MSISIATKFLVVDDSEAMRKVVIQKIRALSGQYCAEATSGEEALAILKKQFIDVVLCNSDMPKMSGLDLLKAVRADSKLCTMPFIIISSEASRDYLLEAIKCGVSSVLMKPYTLDGFSDHIEKALKNPPKTYVAPPVLTKDVPEKSTPAKSTALLTILVVDDTPDFLELLSDVLKAEYRVRVAQNGKKALEICTSDNPPDLVLLDVMMPVMDGFEVARRMREHPNSENIPVIFITSLTTDKTRAQGLDLGAVDFVAKPIDTDILKVRVKNFMRYVKSHKQLQADYDGMVENSRLHGVIEDITRHDLKVPLTSVIQLVEMLIENGELNDRQLESLRMIEDIVLQATRTINLSSDLYKMETGTFELNPQPIRIDAILQRLVRIARETFREKQLELVVEMDVAKGKTLPRVLGDASLCHSLFHNLINNACEYANEKSRVTVSMTNANPIKITVTNQGVVPTKYREAFFEKYLDNICIKWGGAYATKLMAEIQHGSIALSVSDSEKLTILTVYLPRFEDENDSLELQKNIKPNKPEQ